MRLRPVHGRGSRPRSCWPSGEHLPASAGRPRQALIAAYRTHRDRGRAAGAASPRPAWSAAAADPERRGRVSGRARHPPAGSRDGSRRLPGRTRRRRMLPVLAAGRGRRRADSTKSTRASAAGSPGERSGRRGLGGDPGRPPPGIEPAAALADVRFAPDAATLADRDRRCGGALLLASPARLDRACVRSGPDAPVDPIGQRRRRRALFPALVASEVAVTNARGVFDEPIAEWAIGAMCAFATGLADDDRRSKRQQRAGRTTGIGNASPGSISWSSARVRSAARRLRVLAPSG